jgi:hypothetical protein
MQTLYIYTTALEHIRPDFTAKNSPGHSRDAGIRRRPDACRHAGLLRDGYIQTLVPDLVIVASYRC